MKKCETADKENTFFEGVKKENVLQEFKTTGIYPFRFDVPENTEKLKIHAKFFNDNMGNAEATTTAYAAYSPKFKSGHESKDTQFFIQVRSSTKLVRIGSYIVLHVKTNFAFASFDWLILSKDIIWNSGREFGNNIHPETKTFSVVVSPEMSPGFHVIVYARVLKSNQVIADSSYVTIDKLRGLDPHEIELKVIFNS